MKTCKETCVMFEQMKISEQVYKGGAPLKTSIMSDTNCDSHVRKQKGGEYSFPKNPDKVRTGKHKKKFTPSERWFDQCKKDIIVAWPQTLLRGV